MTATGYSRHLVQPAPEVHLPYKAMTTSWRVWIPFF